MCNRRYGGVLFLLTIFSAAAALADPGTQPEETKVPPGKFTYLAETSDWKIPCKAEGAPPDACVQRLLLRQFCRQSLLLAAREELGLIARDAAIGDAVPNGEGSDVPLVMGAKCKEPSGVYVQRSGAETQEVGEFVFDGDYLHAAIRAEEMSRTWYVEALHKLGFSGAATKRNSEAKVPERVEPLLSEMTFTSQFQAVRLLHAAIRHNGESDELLGALVRGYANLGWLTEHHWLAGPDVFKARAILYAQRMVARGEHPAWAKRHRAYALAALGLHKKAMEDIDSVAVPAVDKSEASLDKRPPAWVNLITAHCLFKLDDLQPNKTKESYKQLAELLRIINLELSNGERNRTYHVTALINAAQSMPECYRVIDSLSFRSSAGLGNTTTLLGMQTLGRKLYLRLAQILDLPADAKKIVAMRPAADGDLGYFVGKSDLSPAEEFVIRGRLIDALMGFLYTGDKGATRETSGSEKLPKSALTCEIDYGEPSWVTLGFLIRETSFVQVWRRLWFECFYISISTEDLIDISAPLTVRHPCRLFIEALSTDMAKKQGVLKQLDKQTVWNMDLTAQWVFRSFFDKSKKEYPIIVKQLVENSDADARDLAMLMLWVKDSESKKKYAQALYNISPYCPYARSYLIKYDWEAIAAYADQWEKDALENSAYLLTCLGERYFILKQYTDAERLFKIAIKLSPDMDSHLALAEIYKCQNKMDKWLNILEDFLEQPDYALQHEKIRTTIAYYYIDNDDWEKALDYAEKAAESYAGWCLRLAGECHERLGNWEKAEYYFRAAAQRYDDLSLIWYNYCRRTGHGNLKEANKLMQACVDEIAKFEQTDKFSEMGIYYLLENKPQKALDCFGKYFYKRWNFYEGLHAALTADELGDIAKRDCILKEINSRSKWFNTNNRGYDYEASELAKLISDDLTLGGNADFDPADVDDIIKNSSEQQRMNCLYFVGKYLQLRGKEDRAIHYWKLCLASKYMYGWNRTLSGAELLKRGYKANCYKELAEEKKQTFKKPDIESAEDKQSKRQ